MLEIIFTLDRQLLLLINHFPHNLFINNFFLFFSVTGYFGIFWFVLTLVLFMFDGLDNRKEMLALLFAVLINFILVELILKNIFIRVRPENAFTKEVIQIMSGSNDYSFPSGHATIAFAAAYILSRQRKKLSWLFYLLAFFVAISRVYLGKHYPSDVLAGAILGLLIGFFCYEKT